MVNKHMLMSMLLIAAIVVEQPNSNVVKIPKRTRLSKISKRNLKKNEKKLTQKKLTQKK